MKKNVFWLAAMAAAVSMTSCSLDEVMETTEVRSIGFDAFADKPSRADLDAFPHNNFSVFGAYSNNSGTDYDQIVFVGRDVTKDGGNWTYENSELWVPNVPYRFAAVAPHTAGSTFNYSTQKYTLPEITVDGTPENQIDYMTATVVDVATDNRNTVPFTFNHILSKVDFKFTMATGEDTNPWSSNATIKIKEIKLSANITNTYTNNAWGNSNTPGQFTLNLSGSPLETSYNGTVTESQASTPWLVVPQNNSDRTVSITCDVYNGSNVLIKENATATATIAASTTSWDANTYYTYTLKIGTDITTTNPYITFTVTGVKGWTPGSTTAVDVTPAN